MNKAIIGILSITVASFYACQKPLDAGQVIVEDRVLADSVTSIQANGSFDVYITQDTSYDVRVEAGENVMPYVYTTLSVNELRIGERAHHFIRNKSDDNMWVDIEATLDKNKGHESKDGKYIKLRKWWVYSGVAASVLIVVGMVLFNRTDTNHTTKESTNDIASVKAPDVVEHNLSEISTELAEIEAYYVSQVNDRMDDLKKYQTDPAIAETIETLEEEYKSLSQELGKGGDDEKIIEAMIENYRLKLMVLEDVLRTIKNTDDEVEIEI